MRDYIHKWPTAKLSGPRGQMGGGYSSDLLQVFSEIYLIKLVQVDRCSSHWTDFDE